MSKLLREGMADVLEGEANVRLSDASLGIALAMVREGVGRLGWSTMAYRCGQCRFEWDVWLALGVEGPEALREGNLYVAAPFGMSCRASPKMQACAGTMSHVRLGQDKVFGPTLIPDDAPRFVLPHMIQGSEGATLVVPEMAYVRARRFHNVTRIDVDPSA